MFQLPAKLPLRFTSSQGEWKDLYSPNDYKILTQMQLATKDDIANILENNQNAQKSMAKLHPFERAEILSKVIADLKSKIPYLAWVIATEGGKPLKDATAEANRAVATLELCAEETLRLVGEVVPMERTAAGRDHLAFTLRDPIGPVLAISAFNHPLNLIAHQVGSAIASGCAVVLKPSSSTPISAFILDDAFKNAGLPELGLRVVNAKVELTEVLVQSAEFNFVSFIGSAKVGWEMRRKIAPGTRISMEHGGQAAAIIRADANQEDAAKLLVKSSFYHAGQVCISTQRIFVHESIQSSFLSLFLKHATKLKVGPATDENTDVGPLIKADEVKRLQEWINEAQSAGAKIEIGNKVTGEKGQFLSPTVISNVPRTCKLMTDEAFGPVVCINPYTDETELLEYLNSNDYIFESSLFTQDISHALKIAKEISTMTFVINNHNAFRVDQMPFGGHKMSGLGMGGVKYAMEEMTRIKQIILKT
jgi:acyl-CoA reductase-like NAD-dependent aldehyde dehydrogenase